MPRKIANVVANNVNTVYFATTLSCWNSNGMILWGKKRCIIIYAPKESDFDKNKRCWVIKDNENRRNRRWPIPPIGVYRLIFYFVKQFYFHII